MKTNLFLTIVLTCSIHVYSQISVLNGSFENINTVAINSSCLSDSGWAATINNSMGLPGGKQSLIITDPITDPPCVFAQDGLNYVDLCPTTDHLGISLEMSQPLEIGHEYKVSFYAKKCDINATSAQVSIGYTFDPTSFGNLLYSSPNVDATEWQYFEYVFTFSSSLPGILYLSVSTESPLLPIMPFNIQVDNFSIQDITTMSTQNNESAQLKINIYPNPSIENITVQFNNTLFTGLISMYNLTGAVVFNKELISAENYIINRSTFNIPGVYILAIQSTEKNKIEYRKIIFN